jgi:uncharacterized protein YggE
MRKAFLICILLASASLISAQIDSNSITVVASRSASLQADQAVFGVAVTSGLNASFEDVLGALQGSGITLANFTGVSTAPALLFAPGFVTGTLQQLPATVPPSLQWSFTLAVPVSKIKDTITTLTTVQQNVAKKNNGLSVTFQVQGSQVSPQALLSQTCALTDLIADARAQAQKLADAAGMGVGVILAMSSATSVPTATTAGLSSFLLGAVSLPNCTLTVKFALQRF